MTRYMLDTNTVSYLVQKQPDVLREILRLDIATLSVSSVVVAELEHGLAKRPEATRLALAVREFLKRVDLIAWTSSTAKHYGALRSELERMGQTLDDLDLLIAAHAIEMKATLITHDKAILRTGSLGVGLKTKSWIPAFVGMT